MQNFSPQASAPKSEYPAICVSQPFQVKICRPKFEQHYFRKLNKSNIITNTLFHKSSIFKSIMYKDLTSYVDWRPGNNQGSPNFGKLFSVFVLSII